MFFEADRSKSEFEISCLENGEFEFDGMRSSWPNCIEVAT